MPIPITTAPLKKVRVMVVDDSMLARSLIIKGLSAHPRIEVVGYAINTLDAKNKIPQYQPDVITMDVEMPGQSGIDFLKQYLPTHPIPVILVSSLNLKVFDALAVGAVDFVRKPDDHQSPEAFLAGLAQKVVMAATARPRTAAAVPQAGAINVGAAPSLGASPNLDRVIIGLGASTGGTEATLAVMKRLPADIPPMVSTACVPWRCVRPRAATSSTGAWRSSPPPTSSAGWCASAPATPLTAPLAKRSAATAPRWTPCSTPWPRPSPAKWWASS